MRRHQGDLRPGPCLNRETRLTCCCRPPYLEPAAVVQVVEEALHLREVLGARAAVRQHGVHQVVPRRPTVVVREDVLRVVLIAEERAVPRLARHDAVRAALLHTRVAPAGVAPPRRVRPASHWRVCWLTIWQHAPIIQFSQHVLTSPSIKK